MAHRGSEAIMKAEEHTTAHVTDPQAQAGEWFARLRTSTCSDIDRAAFRRWLNESPAHVAAYRELEAVWARAGALKTTSAAIAAATQAALRDRAPPPRIRTTARRRWQIAIAASVLVALGALAMLPVTQDQLPAEWTPIAWSGERFVTATGEQRRIPLTDGSEVLLDAESILRVRYDEGTRYLALERGQAQFKVAKDAARPFIVKAADGAVRAIGTEFQVRVDGEAVLVTLLEGKVSVDVSGVLAGLVKPAQSETLIAGQQIRYGKKREALAKQPADVEVAQAWTQGDLVFKKWPLDELVAEMNRHTGIKIRIDDEALRDLKVNGRFRAGDQQSLILALQHQWAIQARRVSENEIALSRAAASS